mmetsp:Transcript_14721/g.18489  ORF Transcript_14721/g.18489 Transcript_14721/m.18489 type:complete len:147 (-) Transcript_14721:52-492(-)
MTAGGVNDEGIFHYENHESLEDEVFELHTNNKDGDNEADNIFSRQAVDISAQAKEPGILFGDRSPSHHSKQASSAKQLPEPNTSQDDVSAEEEVGGGSSSVKLDDLAVEAKCATSHESSSDSRGNKDLLGMIDEELEHETELLYEE